MVETSLVGVVLNGLSHLHNIRNRAHFAVSLIHGLGANLSEGTREVFAKEVIIAFKTVCSCWESILANMMLDSVYKIQT